MRTDFRGNKEREETYNWNDYDEIWGFHNIPSDYPERAMHMKALMDRTQGTPTSLTMDRWPAFFRRMERKRMEAM
jgi:hypothetical protein